MNDLDFDKPRIVLIVQDRNERALIAAQLQQDIRCRVDSAPDPDEGLVLLLQHASLVIMDWSNLPVDAQRWARLAAAARGAPMLVLASRSLSSQVDQMGVDPARVLFRPFTVGQVIERARQMVKEKPKNGRANGRDQANDRTNL